MPSPVSGASDQSGSVSERVLTEGALNDAGFFSSVEPVEAPDLRHTADAGPALSSPSGSRSPFASFEELPAPMRSMTSSELGLLHGLQISDFVDMVSSTNLDSEELTVALQRGGVRNGEFINGLDKPISIIRIKPNEDLAKLHEFLRKNPDAPFKVAFADMHGQVGAGEDLGALTRQALDQALLQFTLDYDKCLEHTNFCYTLKPLQGSFDGETEHFDTRNLEMCSMLGVIAQSAYSHQAASRVQFGESVFSGLKSIELQLLQNKAPGEDFDTLEFLEQQLTQDQDKVRQVLFSVRPGLAGYLDNLEDLRSYSKSILSPLVNFAKGFRSAEEGQRALQEVPAKILKARICGEPDLKNVLWQVVGVEREYIRNLQPRAPSHTESSETALTETAPSRTATEGLVAQLTENFRHFVAKSDPNTLQDFTRFATGSSNIAPRAKIQLVPKPDELMARIGVSGGPFNPEALRVDVNSHACAMKVDVSLTLAQQPPELFAEGLTLAITKGSGYQRG